MVNTVVNHSTDRTVWSSEEIDTLKLLVKTQGLKTISKNLNKCTFDICMKYHELNKIEPLIFYKNSSDYVFWTYEKDLYLFLNYEDASMRNLCENIEAPWKKIYRRAVTLGLSRKELSFNTETSLEVAVQNLLKTINPDFESQVRVDYDSSNKSKFYVADFIYEDLKLIIEAQGDYWHGNLTGFPHPSEMQKIKISKDIIRKKYIRISWIYSYLYLGI